MHQELRPEQSRRHGQGWYAQEGHEYELPAPLDRGQHAHHLVLPGGERTEILRYRLPHGLLRGQAGQPQGRLRHFQVRGHSTDVGLETWPLNASFFVVNRDYSKADHFYLFNHVDIVVAYHSGYNEEWGKFLASDEAGGRIVCE